MKKITFLFSILLTILYNQLSFSQVQLEWVQRYDDSLHLNDYTGGVALDKFGNVYVTGSSQFSPNNSFVTIKYSSLGVQKWIANYKVIGAAHVTKIITDSDCNSFVCGYFGSDWTTIYRSILIKYDSTGNLKWVGIFGDTIHSSLSSDEVIDRSGNIYIVGGTNIGIGGVMILKYNQNGDTLWTRIYKQAGYSQIGCNSIAVDSTNNILCAGSCNIMFGYTVSDALILKYNSDGNFLWSNVYNSGGNNTIDFFEKVGIDNNGNVYTTGQGWSGSGGDIWSNFLTIKYNSSGFQQWIRIYGGTNYSGSVALSLALDKNGNIFITGTSQSFVSVEDFATIKYNANGDTLWVKRYDNMVHGNDIAYDIKVDSLGFIYVNGLSIFNGYKITTIKYSNDGVQQWITQYSGNPKYKESSLSVDNSYNVYVIGDNSDNGNGSDYILIKYSQPNGIQNISNEIPGKFELNQNYPNPFNPTTTIEFELPKTSYTKIIVYDLLGREVETLVNEELKAGSYKVDFDGSKLSSGVYFYKLVTKDFIETKKMVVVK